MAEGIEQPGKARAPGPTYQEIILRDSSTPPPAFLEYSYEFMGDEDIPYSRSGADTCLGCHDDSAKVLSIFQNKHAQRGDHRAPFGEGGLQCEACHGPGGDHSRRRGGPDPRPGRPAAAGSGHLRGDRDRFRRR